MTDMAAALSALLPILRANGVRRFDCDAFSLEMGDAPAEPRAVVEAATVPPTEETTTVAGDTSPLRFDREELLFMHELFVQPALRVG